MNKPKFFKSQDAPEVKNQGDPEYIKGADAAEISDKRGVSESKDHEDPKDIKGADAAEISDKRDVPEVKDQEDPEDIKGTDAAEISDKKEIPEGMKEYFKLYPKEKTFYRTSDGQVFLEADKQWANEHQKHVGGEVETINRR